jgi:two-component system chemotaxis response regulator CheB
MPANALAQVPDALVHPAGKIGAVLAELVDAPVPPPDDAYPDPAADTDPRPTPAPADSGALLGVETTIASAAGPTTDRLPQAPASPFSCPSCHGVLFELPGEPAPRFRCRVGHAWSPASLEEEQARSVDEALWVAMRTLEEKAALLERLAAEAGRRGHRHSAGTYTARATAAHARAEQVRALVHPDDQPANAPAS